MTKFKKGRFNWTRLLNTVLDGKWQCEVFSLRFFLLLKMTFNRCQKRRNTKSCYSKSYLQSGLLKLKKCILPIYRSAATQTLVLLSWCTRTKVSIRSAPSTVNPPVLEKKRRRKKERGRKKLRRGEKNRGRKGETTDGDRWAKRQVRKDRREEGAERRRRGDRGIDWARRRRRTVGDPADISGWVYEMWWLAKSC